MAEARRGPEAQKGRPRKAQKGPERPREAQRGPEKHGPEKPRESQRGPERPREAQRGPERPTLPRYLDNCLKFILQNGLSNKMARTRDINDSFMGPRAPRAPEFAMKSIGRCFVWLQHQC